MQVTATLLAWCKDAHSCFTAPAGTASELAHFVFAGQLLRPSARIVQPRLAIGRTYDRESEVNAICHASHRALDSSYGQHGQQSMLYAS